MSSETEKKDAVSLLKRNKGALRKAVIALFLISTLTISVGFAQETEQKAVFNKIYHVYAGNEYIGYVSDEKIVQSVISQKQQLASTQFKGLHVATGADVSIIPEQIFAVEMKDEQTLKKLEDVLQTEAEAYALQIEGETVAYLNDQQSYEAIINDLKLQFVTQQQLDELNKRQDANINLPPLAENETRIIEVSFSKNVEGKLVKVHPSKVMPTEQVLELLKTGTLAQEVYTVEQGDVLGSIAQKYNLTIGQLLELNPGLTADSVLKIGQALNVTVKKALVSVKVVTEGVKAEVIKFEKEMKIDGAMLKGESKVTQSGEDGKKQITYEQTLENGVTTNIITTNETVLQPAVNEVTIVGTKVIPSRGTGTFVWPTNGGYISSNMGSRWGAYHRGIDIARPSNYTIKAVDNGVVVAAGWSGSYGYRIVIDHNNGYTSLYGHLLKINVNVGQVVAQGSAIGVMGSTGNSTGTHLHLEIEKNGSLVNPLSYLR